MTNNDELKAKLSDNRGPQGAHTFHSKEKKNLNVKLMRYKKKLPFCE